MNINIDSDTLDKICKDFMRIIDEGGGIEQFDKEGLDSWIGDYLNGNYILKSPLTI